MTGLLPGAGIGLLAGVGLVTALWRVPAFRRPTLDDRLAPYLRDAPRRSRLLESQRMLTPFPTLERLLAPAIRDAARVIERVLGGSASIRRRLEMAGRGMTLEQFRVEQLAWGAAGLLLSLVVAVLYVAREPARAVPAAVLCLVAGVGGVLLRDHWLSREVEIRERRMMMEFPTVAELLALAVAAGEGAVGALERVVRLSHGELAAELSRALGEARAGAPLVHAMQGVADRTSLPPLARFADGIAIAVERGTPLADVLRAQAMDVREASRRALLDSGGKKEIGMMVPVVFLVLPVTVIFALYPGFLGFSFTI
jgi:tight adherence protein C